MIYASVPVLQSPDMIPDQARSWHGCGPELLIVDNTNDGDWKALCDEYGWSHAHFGKNLGVAPAWNLARAKFMADTERGHDLLLIFSASVVWNDGLPQVLDQLSCEANWKGCQTQLGFHAIAWSRKLFELAGTFDENYAPAAYYADNDFAYRLIVLGILVANPDPMPHVPMNVSPVTDALAVKSCGIEGNYGACHDYYTRKWLGEPSQETARTPFGMDVPLGWWSNAFRPGLEHVDPAITRTR